MPLLFVLTPQVLYSLLVFVGVSMSKELEQYRFRCKETVRATQKSAYSFRKDDNFSKIDIDVDFVSVNNEN